MIAACRAACALLALATGVAACAVTTPPPSALVGPSRAEERPSALPTPSATASPSHRPAGDLGRELEVLALDPAWTEPTLEFASDGESIIFSSGVADGPDVEFAPDLWRYVPGADAPELLWQNPNRDHSLTRIGGEFGTWAFVDMPVSGEIAWDLWLLPEADAEPILLDSHPGDRDVPDLVPSFSVHQGQVAWTSFDEDPDGSVVSRLYYARGPAWEPVVVQERDARSAELWFPSLRDSQIAFCEVVYSADRTTDERHVYLVDALNPDVAPRRLDASGRATMPLLMVNGGVAWKEADPGFSMFNWGRMYRYDETTGEVAAVPTRPQEYVNYPSAGGRFMAWWGADSLAFGVYDRELGTSRLIDRLPPESNVHVLRPHLAWDLLVWLHSEFDGMGNGPEPQIRYAFLPGAGTSRGD